jgi:hypothetical protein
MSAIKGYSSQEKLHEEDYDSHDFVNVMPIGQSRYGLATLAFSQTQLVAADAAEADSTIREIVATGHSAKVGMVVEFTSGSASGEYAMVTGVEANLIKLGQPLSVAPSATDTFDIKRFVLGSVSSTGSITVVQGSRDSVELARHEHSTPITTAAYTELIAATAGTIGQLLIFDSSGETLVLAVGGSGSEVDQLYIDLSIPAGSRVSIKAVSANTASGELTVTALS